LVVAYALAGTTDIDLVNDPIGKGKDGKDVYLKDIWPTAQEVQDTIDRCVLPEMFRTRYTDVMTSNETWNKLPTSKGDLYGWDTTSTYIQEPPFFENF
jgi:aconitate hydratase